MIALLLVAGLLAPDAPLAGTALWRFPDPYATQIRDAVVQARGTGLPGHLVTDDEISAFLARAKPAGADLGCSDDRTVCADPLRAALSAVGLTSRIDATAERTDAGWKITLNQTSLGDGPVAPFTGEGDTVAAAVEQALAGLQGQGSVRVAVVPEGARLLLDGQPWGTGSGTYPARPGKHMLRAEFDGRRPVEIPITVARGQTTATSVQLPVAYGKLVFVTDPPTATILLDGGSYTSGELRELRPGTYTLEIGAPGYQPAKHTITIKPAIQLDLNLKLTPEHTDWWALLQSPHPDTLKHVWLVRGDLRFDWLGSAKLNRTRGPVALNEQTDSLALAGVGFTLTWRSRLLIVDALALTFQGGAGPAAADFDDGEGKIRDEFRMTVRPAWFGVRYPMWRLEPYAVGGPLFAFDSFDAEGPAGDTESFDATGFALGLQLGTRFFFNADWFAHVAFDSTFWFGERPTAGFLLGGGFAFDYALPEWL
ncbi:MAG: PEGA domain-containing protein [Myxococcales bacterium]|nr:PEGA domain-containing protein [Myxococcales bacterium]